LLNINKDSCLYKLISSLIQLGVRGFQVQVWLGNFIFICPSPTRVV